VWLYFKGEPRPDANPRYLDAQSLLLAARSAAGDTASAQTRLEAMVKAAPNNTHLRVDLAALYRSRAQARRAEIELKLAETMSPRALAVEHAQASVALDLHAWRQAEMLIHDTLARAPENTTSQRLARRWQVHNRAELRASVNAGRSPDSAADNTASGSRSLEFDTVLYTAPLAYDWRAFAGLGYAQGRYREGVGHARWQRAGLEWRARDWWVEGEVAAQNDGHGTKPGAALAFTHEIDDHWQVGAKLERLSRATPLRARHSGIHAHATQGHVRWRAHEERAWRVDWDAAHFSDGNQRRSVSVNGSERLLTRPRWQFDLLLDVSTQGNSQDDARPYFNPKRDLMVLPALRATQVLTRRYDTVWEHELTLSAGSYWQRHYGSHAALGLAYGQRWRANDVFEVAFGVSASSRPYDGARERELQFWLDLNVRF